MAKLVQPVDLEPARAAGLGAVLRKALSFPAFLGFLLVAGTCANTDLKLQKLQSLPSGQYHIFFVEGDTWWHLAVGARILSTHSWPTSDSYSFTAQGSEWIAYEWLGEVVMALALRFGALRGAMLLLIGLAGAIMLLAYYYSYLRCGNVKAAFVACVALFPLASLSFSLRPQLFGYIFLLITLVALERFRQGQRKSLWILPGVFLLWVNTHGSFVFGLLVLAVYLASGLMKLRWGRLETRPWSARQRQHLLAIALFSVLLLTITPYGTRLAAYPLEMALLQPDLMGLLEWQPLSFGELYGKLVLILVLLFLLSLIVFRATYRLEEVGLLLLGTYAACRHARFALLFMIFFAPLLAGALGRLLPQYHRQKDHFVLNLALAVLIGAGLIKFFPTSQELAGAMAYGFPQGAVQYLRRHPVPAPMFNVDYWGGYLIQSLGPDHKVFIDGRFDLYEYAGVVHDYVGIYGLQPRSTMLLRKYNVRSCLIERNSPLAASIANSPDWRQVYADDLSVLYVQSRRDAGFH